MATSGTTTFEKSFYIDQVIEDAYERIGLQATSGYQLKTARRSLNILFQEWGNRGIHYWEVGDTNITPVEGQAVYKLYRSAADATAGGSDQPYMVYRIFLNVNLELILIIQVALRLIWR